MYAVYISSNVYEKNMSTLANIMHVSYPYNLFLDIFIFLSLVTNIGNAFNRYGLDMHTKACYCEKAFGEYN